MEAPDCPGCRALLAQLAETQAKLLAVEARLRDLEDKHKKTPPPRPLTPQPPAPDKKPTGKKPGGQPGHPPHLKTLVPAERVNTFATPHVPTHCSACDKALSLTPQPGDPEPRRHQVAELPLTVVAITEHQAHGRTCSCGHVTWAAIPADVRQHTLGPRLTALLGLLSGRYGVSKRDIEDLFTETLDAPISLGTVSNYEHEVSLALAAAHAEAQAAVAAAPVKHVDETGWKQAGKKRWLWVAAIPAGIVCFLIHPRRNFAALAQLIGPTLAGILCSDRWKVYDDWPGKRQLCWAHVKRNWEKKVEAGGVAREVGEAWLELQGQVFEMWHRFRKGSISRHELGDALGPRMLAMWDVLWRGRDSDDGVLARFCERLASGFLSLWTFAMEEGVEPTNNEAERVLRRAVVWRRRSFGCHSAEGCRFVERILTVVQSLRHQKRPVLEFVASTIAAHREGRTTPKLQFG